MPLSPATALLFDQAYVQYQYPILGTRLQPTQVNNNQQCNTNSGLKQFYLVINLFYVLCLQYLLFCKIFDTIVIVVIFVVCRSQGLTGNCCPTNDGTVLGCCDSFANGGSKMQDEWKSYILNDLAGTKLC